MALYRCLLLLRQHRASLCEGVPCRVPSFKHILSLCAGGADKNVVVFDKREEQIVATLKGHTKKVTSVIYHPSQVEMTGRPAVSPQAVCSYLTHNATLSPVVGGVLRFPGQHYPCVVRIQWQLRAGH